MLRILIGQDNLEEASSGKAGIMTGSALLSGHAFSVSDSCLRFNRNKSSVTLLTDPCFLGKNQIPDWGTEPVIIPALPEDASSRLSCPIRILSIYLERKRKSTSSAGSKGGEFREARTNPKFH
jgi:hypothetical protein